MVQMLQNFNLLSELLEQQVLVVHLHVELAFVDHLAGMHDLTGPALAPVDFAGCPDADNVCRKAGREGGRERR